MLKHLNRLLEILVYSILVFLVVLTFLQVIMRYLFNNPFTFAEELLRIALVWLAMLGTAYGIGLRKHMSLVFLQQKTKDTSCGLWIAGSIDLIVIAFLLIFFVIGGFRFVWSSFGSLTPAMQWNKAYVYSVIPISGIIGIAAQCLCLFDEFIERRSLIGLKQV